jgi:hypothetical protein
MPPKKAEKVPRRARARALDRRRPHPATGLKIIGASLVVLALGVGWLNAVGRSEENETAMPYNQGGVTTVAGGAGGGMLPSTRAAVPVPFGPNALVTVDEGLVAATTTPEGKVTTTSLLAASHPATTWVERWLLSELGTTTTAGGRGPSAPHPGHPGTTGITRPPAPSSTTSTTRPTTTTSTSTTSTTSTTQPTTTSSSTTTTTEPTTSTTEGSTTTAGDGSTTTSP